MGRQICIYLLGLGEVMEETEGSAIKLSGDLTIRNITEVYQVMAHAISQGDAILLNIDDSSDVDISFVQMIEAARLSSARNGGDLTLSSPATGQLADTLERGGFLGRTGDAATSFWQSGR